MIALTGCSIDTTTTTAHKPKKQGGAEWRQGQGGSGWEGAASQPQCEPAYPDVCIPPNSTYVTCDDVGETDFTADPPDPYGLDVEADGVGCETDLDGNLIAELDADGDGCVDSYPSVCLDPTMGNQDCIDVIDEDIDVDYSVETPDPYYLDEDADGVGCESVDSSYGGSGYDSGSSGDSGYDDYDY